MKSRIFPPIDEEVVADFHNTWVIDDWKGLPSRTNGPSFVSNDISFRILIFPEGNRADSVSLYLEAAPVVPEPSEANGNETNNTSEVNNAKIESIADDESKSNTVLPASGPAPTATPPQDNDWAVCAQFGLVMWNPEEPSVYHSMFAQHRFNPDEGDWGFTRFYELRRLYSRHNDQDRALIENNAVNITAYIRIIKDPTGVLWHNFFKYNSKKETGFVGLKNQGATCYLNSLLQSLYFTKVFRRAVYKIPTQEDKPNSVPSALQRLFYLLSTSEAPVGTLQLTRSFGWDSADAFTQHDVQELNRVLMDKLEGKMKGTEVEGALNSIFVAQMKSYVKCVNVDFESSRTEDYWDIQLNVKGMKDIEESFKDYIQVEMLDGENQYQATGFGLQDATKGVVFQSFPPVLHLQLKRYEYDFNRDMEVKINDRYEFPIEVDLSPYLEEGSDMSEPWIYTLHGVLVHSGDLNAGHYYALLKPTKEEAWYKFDDDRVTRATLKEVLEENFGGDALPPQQPPGINQPQQQRNRLNYKRHSSAYMLVYLRKSRLDEILPTSEDIVPEHIPRRLELEVAEENARRKEREEQHFYMSVRVMSNAQFTKYQGFDIGNWDLRDQAGISDESRPIAYKILKTTSIREFLEILARNNGIQDLSRLQLWLMVNRQNKTFRLDFAVTPSDYELTMDQLREKTQTPQDLRLWLEILPENNNKNFSNAGQNHYQQQTIVTAGVGGAGVGIGAGTGGGGAGSAGSAGPAGSAGSAVVATGDSNGEKMEFDDQQRQHSQINDRVVFLKYFDVGNQLITGVGTIRVNEQDRIGSIIKSINEMMGWDPATRLQLVEEIKPEMIDVIRHKSTFQDSEISDGDIICFERVLDKEESERINGYTSVFDFYDFLLYRTLFSFRKRSSQEVDSNGNNEGSFELWINRKDSYDQLADKVGRYLGVDPTHLQFFTTQLNGYERSPVKRTAGGTLQQLLIPTYANQHSPVSVLYEILDMSLAELEKKKVVTVAWLTDGLSQEHKYDILVAKTATMQDVISILKERANISAQVLSRIKLWGSLNGRVHRTYNDSFPVQSISEDVQVHATVCPQDEFEYINAAEAPADQRLIFVVHFQKDPSRTHSTPFTFVLRAGEVFSETKARLQKVLGVYDKVFEKIKFAVIKADYRPPEYITDDDELFSIIGENDYLGLDHVDKTIRRGYGQQAAIFIKN